MGIAGAGTSENQIHNAISNSVTSSNVANPVLNLNLASERIDNTTSPNNETSPTNVADLSSSQEMSSDLAASVGILGGSGGPASLSKESTGLSDSEGPNDIISKLFSSDNGEISPGFVTLGALVVIGGGYYLWKKSKRG